MEPLKPGWDGSRAEGSPCPWHCCIFCCSQSPGAPWGSSPSPSAHPTPDLKALPAPGLRSSSVFRDDMTMSYKGVLKADPGPPHCSKYLQGQGWEQRGGVCSKGEWGAHTGSCGDRWDVPGQSQGVHWSCHSLHPDQRDTTCQGSVPSPEQWQEGSHTHPRGHGDSGGSEETPHSADGAGPSVTAAVPPELSPLFPECPGRLQEGL